MSGSGPGLLASLQRLSATALEIAQVRLELLAVEVEQEKLRIFDGLFWAAVALLLLVIGLMLAVAGLLMLFWEGYRLPAVGVLCALFLVAGVLTARVARQRLAQPEGQAIGATLDELSRDRQALAGRE